MILKPFLKIIFMKKELHLNIVVLADKIKPLITKEKGKMQN
jgi:hypothetical protein